MKGIDLFSGAGGMSVGAMASGIDIRFAVESDPNAAATYRINHPDVDVIEDDIRNVSNFSKFRFDDEVVVFGGPPCQGFSTSNQRNRSSDNPNNWLFREFLRIVSGLEPDWVVFENVKGIVETENAAFLHHVQCGLKGLGYALSTGVLDATGFGVPQRRSRLFIIGSRHGLQIALPKSSTATPVTVREALSDLPDLSNGSSVEESGYKKGRPSKYAKQMRGRRKQTYNHIVTRNANYILKRYTHIPPGGNWEDIPNRLMGNYADRTRCHTGIYRRLMWDEPSVVIGNYRKNMLIHPQQDRGLSVREAARLQSFPDWFRFTGSIGFQQQQVGNAVPPLLAKAVFDTIQSPLKSGCVSQIAAE